MSTDFGKCLQKYHLLGLTTEAQKHQKCLESVGADHTGIQNCKDCCTSRCTELLSERSQFMNEDARAVTAANCRLLCNTDCIGFAQGMSDVDVTEKFMDKQKLKVEKQMNKLTDRVDRASVAE